MSVTDATTNDATPNDKMLYDIGKVVVESADGKLPVHLEMNPYGTFSKKWETAKTNTNNRITWIIPGFPKISNIYNITSSNNYWVWANGMKSFLLFLYTMVAFGIAIFIFKLIAFNSILSHKDTVSNDPLVRYLRVNDLGFQNLKDAPKTSILGMIYSMYLGIISTYNNSIAFILTTNQNMNKLKRNIDKDLFQPFLLKTIVPIIDNFRK